MEKIKVEQHGFTLLNNFKFFIYYALRLCS